MVEAAGRRTVWGPVRRIRAVSFASLLAVAAVLAGCAGGDTLPAENVGDTSATVRGVVFSTTDGTIQYWFEYGTTKDYGSETPGRSLAINDRDNHSVSEALTGLDPGTKYHYRVCASGPDPLCAKDRKFTTTGVATKLAISADPSLVPRFDPDVSDYVTRCGGKAVGVDVSAPAGTTVAVGGGGARGGTFSTQVPLNTGKSFDFIVQSGGARTYHVRCLPSDFPRWSWTSPGNPSAPFYITMPRNVQTPEGTSAGRYVAIFNDEGVPVWWMESSGSSDAKLLPDGNLAWGRTAAAGSSSAGYEIHELDGTLLKTWRTVGSATDIHDFETLPNGNALMMSYPPRPGTQDLTEYGGPATNGTPIDAEIQEIKPDGSVAWAWNAKDHIDLDETPERWRGIVYIPQALPGGRQGFDWAHVNSLQKVGDTVVVSFRHLDAVYAIDMDTGDIIWKLGGTTTPESLSVVGDPESNPLGGQHYARILPNGNLTLFDNNTNETAPPRGVEYELGLSAGTATMVDSVNDPDVPTSPCCGSAAKLADGSWLVSWGGTEVISEFGANGSRHFKLQFTSNAGSFGFSYRVDPITGSNPTIGDLRAGMDAMP